MSSPAEGRSFQPTTSTAVLGPASVTARPFSSNRKRTLAQLFPATSTAPLFSAPRWTMVVVTGLEGRPASGESETRCGQKDGQTDRWTDRERSRDSQTDRRTDGQAGRKTEGQTDDRDRWTDRWTEGQTGSQTGGQTSRQADGQTDICGQMGEGHAHSPFATIGAALDDHTLHWPAGLRLQLHDLGQRHCGLSQGQQVVALAT